RRLLVEPAGARAAMQLARDVLERHVARRQADEGVEEQIGRLGDHALLRSARNLGRQFIGLFANLLADLVLLEQLADVRLRARARVLARHARLVQRLELRRRRLVAVGAEAGLRPGVAGRPRRQRAHQPRVGVAVGLEIDQLQDVARRLALLPQALARARPEPDLAGL